MSHSEVYEELTWERRDAGITRKAPLAYFNDEYQFAIFPGEGGSWDLCWAAPEEGYSLLEPGLTVAEAKRAAAREVAKGMVSRVP